MPAVEPLFHLSSQNTGQVHASLDFTIDTTQTNHLESFDNVLKFLKPFTQPWSSQKSHGKVDFSQQPMHNSPATLLAPITGVMTVQCATPCQIPSWQVMVARSSTASSNNSYSTTRDDRSTYSTSPIDNKDDQGRYRSFWDLTLPPETSVSWIRSFRCLRDQWSLHTRSPNPELSSLMKRYSKASMIAEEDTCYPNDPMGNSNDYGERNSRGRLLRSRGVVLGSRHSMPTTRRKKRSAAEDYCMRDDESKVGGSECWDKEKPSLFSTKPRHKAVDQHNSTLDARSECSYRDIQKKRTSRKRISFAEGTAGCCDTDTNQHNFPDPIMPHIYTTIPCKEDIDKNKMKTSRDNIPKGIIKKMVENFETLPEDAVWRSNFPCRTRDSDNYGVQRKSSRGGRNMKGNCSRRSTDSAPVEESVARRNREDYCRKENDLNGNTSGNNSSPRRDMCGGINKDTNLRRRNTPLDMMESDDLKRDMAHESVERSDPIRGTSSTFLEERCSRRSRADSSVDDERRSTTSGTIGDSNERRRLRGGSFTNSDSKRSMTGKHKKDSSTIIGTTCRCTADSGSKQIKSGNFIESGSTRKYTEDHSSRVSVTGGIIVDSTQIKCKPCNTLGDNYSRRCKAGCCDGNNDRTSTEGSFSNRRSRADTSVGDSESRGNTNDCSVTKSDSRNSTTGRYLGERGSRRSTAGSWLEVSGSRRSMDWGSRNNSSSVRNMKCRCKEEGCPQRGKANIHRENNINDYIQNKSVDSYSDPRNIAGCSCRLDHCPRATIVDSCRENSVTRRSTGDIYKEDSYQRRTTTDSFRNASNARKHSVDSFEKDIGKRRSTGIRLKRDGSPRKITAETYREDNDTRQNTTDSYVEGCFPRRNTTDSYQEESGKRRSVENCDSRRGTEEISVTNDSDSRICSTNDNCMGYDDTKNNVKSSFSAETLSRLGNADCSREESVSRGCVAGSFMEHNASRKSTEDRFRDSNVSRLAANYYREEDDPRRSTTDSFRDYSGQRRSTTDSYKEDSGSRRSIECSGRNDYCPRRNTALGYKENGGLRLSTSIEGFAEYCDMKVNQSSSFCEENVPGMSEGESCAVENSQKRSTTGDYREENGSKVGSVSGSGACLSPINPDVGCARDSGISYSTKNGKTDCEVYVGINTTTAVCISNSESKICRDRCGEGSSRNTSVSSTAIDLQSERTNKNFTNCDPGSVAAHNARDSKFDTETSEMEDDATTGFVSTKCSINKQYDTDRRGSSEYLGNTSRNSKYPQRDDSKLKSLAEFIEENPASSTGSCRSTSGSRRTSVNRDTRGSSTEIHARSSNCSLRQTDSTQNVENCREPISVSRESEQDLCDTTCGPSSEVSDCLPVKPITSSSKITKPCVETGCSEKPDEDESESLMLNSKNMNSNKIKSRLCNWKPSASTLWGNTLSRNSISKRASTTIKSPSSRSISKQLLASDSAFKTNRNNRSTNASKTCGLFVGDSSKTKRSSSRWRIPRMSRTSAAKQSTNSSKESLNANSTCDKNSTETKVRRYRERSFTPPNKYGSSMPIRSSTLNNQPDLNNMSVDKIKCEKRDSIYWKRPTMTFHENKSTSNGRVQPCANDKIDVKDTFCSNIVISEEGVTVLGRDGKVTVGHNACKISTGSILVDCEGRVSGLKTREGKGCQNKRFPGRFISGK